MDKLQNEMYCPECGKIIKKDFSICPYCRNEIKKPEIKEAAKVEKIPEPATNKKKLTDKQIITRVLIWVFIGVAIIVGISVSIGLCSNPSKDSQPAMDSQNKLIEAFVASQDVIEDYLTYPGSAKFPSFSDDDVNVSYILNGEYKVYSYVDSQNSYGALERVYYSCIIKLNSNNTYNVKDLSIIE